jgi:Caspase domain
VTILSPQEGDAVNGSTVEVHYRVRSPSGERVTSVQVLVDGRPLEGQRGVPTVLEDGPAAPEAERDESTIVPVDHDETISLIARAGERAGEAATVKVLWKGQKPFTAPQGSLYLLAVGISDYQVEALRQGVHFAAKDAADVVDAFKRQEGGLYRKVVPRLLQDGNATKDEILKDLDWLEDKSGKHDIAMLFLSGHGTTDRDGDYYFLAHDSNPNDLRRTGVPNGEFAKTLSHVEGKALFFFDTCRSGSVSRPDVNFVANTLSNADQGNVWVFAASKRNEPAVEQDQLHNGAVTSALVEALTGRADASTYRNGRVTVYLLASWLGDRVPRLTTDAQHPASVPPRVAAADFAVAERR